MRSCLLLFRCLFWFTQFVQLKGQGGKAFSLRRYLKGLYNFPDLCLHYISSVFISCIYSNFWEGKVATLKLWISFHLVTAVLLLRTQFSSCVALYLTTVFDVYIKNVKSVRTVPELTILYEIENEWWIIFRR